MNHGAARESRRNCDVEQTASAHVNAERDVRVRLLAAGVVLGVSLGGDVVDRPFLVLRRVVDARRKRRRVVDDVQLVATVCPGDEHDKSPTLVCQYRPHLGQVSANTALVIHSLCDVIAGAISVFRAHGHCASRR